MIISFSYNLRLKKYVFGVTCSRILGQVGRIFLNVFLYRYFFSIQRTYGILKQNVVKFKYIYQEWHKRCRSLTFQLKNTSLLKCFLDSREKSLGSLLFRRKSRVTVNIDFFGLSYNTNKRTQTQSEMCGPNYLKQLQTCYISQCVHKTCTLCLTTLYTKDCKTYPCLTCFLVLLNAGGRSFLSPSTSPELQS